VPALSRSRSDLEACYREVVEQRLALLGHELRSPVAALVAIAETLGDEQRPLAPDVQRRLLHLACAAARDVERIVIDASPTSLRRERVETRRLVTDAVTTAAIRGGAVRAEADDDLPPLDADPVRLRQALANLIANAVSHSPAGAVVVVTARVRENAIELAVRDAGSGVPVGQREAIFAPGARFAERPGQGIGLAVARAVAEAHGGTIELDSAPGRGATFRLVLPRAAEV
jgi:signal transduction histidine kinase